MFGKRDPENRRDEWHGWKLNIARAELRDGPNGQGLVQRGRKLNGLRVDKFLKLFEERGEKRVEHRNGKKVLVEEVFMPMSAVFGVRDLGVNSHYRGE